jgi:hypothetical protein
LEEKLVSLHSHIIAEQLEKVKIHGRNRERDIFLANTAHSVLRFLPY